jgi:Ca2+-binding RTX toxin-like protein
VECLIAYSGLAYRQFAMDYQQKRFSSKSRPLGVVLAIFTGVIMMITIPLAPVLVFAANIQGTPGDDTLNGTPKADTINGLDGNDKLFGKSGDDTLDGGAGDDEIYGGPGNDEIKDNEVAFNFGNKVYGGSGEDNIDAGKVTSTGGMLYYIYGEAGSDYIEVIADEGIVDGGPDDDTIYCIGIIYCGLNGNQGDDEIHIQSSEISSASASGGSGNDKLYCKSGEELRGNDGNDYLFGCAFQDGGKGDDVLEGGNSYTGGPGADTFKCSPGPGDTVEDYNPEEGDTASDDCEIINQ